MFPICASPNNYYICPSLQVYLYVFISLFIYVVLSVFISLISDTYETLHVSSAVRVVMQ